MQNSVPQPAPAKLRLLSMLYDGFLLMAILFISMAIFTAIVAPAGFKSGHPVYTVFFLSVCFLFFAWFWTHEGQTLGMRTWKIKLISEQQQPVRWSQALLRYMTALPGWIVILTGSTRLFLNTPVNFPAMLDWINQLPGGVLLGIGLIMLYLDQRPDNWRDRFSQTRIIRIEYSTKPSQDSDGDSQDQQGR